LDPQAHQDLKAQADRLVHKEVQVHEEHQEIQDKLVPLDLPASVAFKARLVCLDLQEAREQLDPRDRKAHLVQWETGVRQEPLVRKDLLVLQVQRDR